MSEQGQTTEDLCSKCDKIDFNTILAGRWLEDKPLLERTLAEARIEEQCPLCRAIWSHSEPKLRREDNIDCENVNFSLGVRRFRFRSEYKKKGNWESTRCFGLELRLQSGIHVTYMYLDILCDECNLSFTKGGLAMTRRPVPETFDISDLREWLDLDDQYETAKQSPEQSSFSSLISSGRFRVIDVVSGTIIAPRKPVKYCALSYVLGNLTARQRIACKLAPIRRRTITNSNDIPRTFRDAIDIVRAMGERYLWIDAMCIRPGDTTAVILCMGTIYAASYLTIIAAQGENADAGLGRISGLPNKAERPLEIKGRYKDVSLLPSRIRTVRETLQDTTWSTRAWTFQEYLMSRRSVISTNDEVFFHSQNMDVREAYRLHLLFPEFDTQHGGICKSSMVTLNTPDAPALTAIGISRDGLFQGTAFRSLIGDYSSRSSTYDGDRLDAFIGIAALFGPATTIEERTALSGLDQNDFAQALGWYTDTSSARILKNHRKTRYLPSWRWVGWTGKMSCVRTGVKIRKVQIVDEANIVCNLTATTEAVGPVLCKPKRMLCVTLHLWTALIGFSLARSTIDGDETFAGHVFNPGQPQVVTPLRDLFDKQILINEEMYESIHSTKSTKHYLLPLHLQQGSLHQPRFFIIIKQSGEFYERVGHLRILFNFSDMEDREQVQNFLHRWGSEPQWIRMR